MSFHFVTVGCACAAASLLEVQPSLAQELLQAVGPHHRVQFASASLPEPVGGASPPAVAFVELATGLNRWEETSQRWVPAQAEWEQTSEGYFIARKTAHRVILTPNLNTVGAADVLAPDGVRLRATPFALAYRDARTSESVVLATIQDCRGVWVSATEVEYPQAFAGTAAMVLYRLDRDRFEQEVILQERLPRPEELGLEPASTWLVVISEFYEVSAPDPVASDSTAGSGQDWLSFGVMALAPGKAFLLDEDAEEAVPVLKHWETAGGRSFLVEAVSYTAVRALLEGLPEPDQARARAPRTPGGRLAWPIRPAEHETPEGVPRFEEGRLVVDEVHWADRGQGSGDRLDLAGPGSRGATEPPRFAQADPHRGGERRGVVLDYLVLTSQSSLTLQGDTTYYVTGTVNVQHLTVEGGAVVKYDTPATARVSVSSSVTCRTGPYRPAFFTHKSDNTVGETVATGDPSASYVGYPLLELAGSSGASLEHLRFRYGDPATSWVLKDNLFDRCTFSVYGQATDNSHNAYHQVGSRMPGAHDDITLTSVNYLTGPHGFHYYPNSGTTGLRALVNAGSTSAGARDLYFFTTHENQAPEGTTILDIGYHYPPAVPFLTVTTNLIGAVDLGYHPGNQSLIVSVNFHNGLPINFRRVASNGGVSDWSSAAGYGFEVPSECAQTTSGVFTMGETFLGEHPYFPSVPARIWRISPTGTLDGSPWVELRESTGNPPRAEYDFKPQSLCLDTTGVFGGDLLVATGWLETDTGGNVWRVNRSNKSVTLLAALTDCLEGLMVCPNNPSKYGSTLAGKLLVGAGTRRLLHVIGPQGGHSSTDLGITIFDLHTVAPAQSLYCLEFRYKAGTVNWPDHYTGQSRLLKVSPEFFSNIAGDILLVRSGEATPVAYSPDGALFLLRWDGTRYVSLQVSDDLPRILEHAVFAPVSLPATP